MQKIVRKIWIYLHYLTWGAEQQALWKKARIRAGLEHSGGRCWNDKFSL